MTKQEQFTQLQINPRRCQLTYCNLELCLLKHGLGRWFLATVAYQCRPEYLCKIENRHLAIGAARNALQVQNQKGESVTIGLRQFRNCLIYSSVRVISILNFRRSCKVSPETHCYQRFLQWSGKKIIRLIRCT